MLPLFKAKGGKIQENQSQRLGALQDREVGVHFQLVLCLSSKLAVLSCGV